MTDSLKQRIKTLIASDTELLLIVEELRQLKNEGYEQEVVRNVLEDLRMESQTETEEDRLLEVLDFVTGFCSPDYQVWPPC